MVQAGKGTDAVIDQLAERFDPGDIIVDGGNANFLDTIRREQDLRERGLNFVGTGISGGEEGALNGPSIMPGGSDEAWETLGPILESIAAVAEGEPCVTHVGTDGAGHFVKMVHNGIEYADMQLIAESYDLLRRVGGHTATLAEVFDEWNEGDLESYLIEITAEVLKQKDADTGKPLVDLILDQAGLEGHRRLDRAERRRPRHPGLRHRRGRVRPGGVVQAGAARRRAARCSPARRSPRPDTFADDVRAALYASKVVAYAQGFDIIIAGAEEYGWNIDLGAVAKIWRGGCIIRARFLNRIVEAYDRNPELERCSSTSTSPRPSPRARPPGAASSASRRLRRPRAGLLLRAVVLRRALLRPAAGGADPGPARLLRRAHLRAHRQGGHLPHAVVRRPPRGRAGAVDALGPGPPITSPRGLADAGPSVHPPALPTTFRMSPGHPTRSADVPHVEPDPDARSRLQP